MLKKGLWNGRREESKEAVTVEVLRKMRASGTDVTGCPGGR